MIVEISTHGSVLKRHHETFLIANENEKVEVPAKKVDAIVITANTLISTQAVRLCIERNIQLVIADWTGRPVGRFWVSSAGKNTEIRRKQYLNQETSVAFDISFDVTSTKLRRQRKLLIDLKHNRKSANRDLEIAISSITSSISKLSQIKFCDGWKETLLGVEGSSAAVYFRAVSASLPSEWSFQQRSQYPAKDGFNAVLNYIYGMGYVSVEKAIILSGLDPNAGFYHADSYGKPTLSFDIMELVRPLLDRTAISFFTKRVADKGWFEEQEKGEGIFLSKKARTTIIESYSEKNKKVVEKEAWDYCKKIISMLCT